MAAISDPGAAAMPAPHHQARFCAIWAVAGPLLDELKGLIPGFGPLIIGSLAKIGDKIAQNNGCGRVAAEDGGPGPIVDIQQHP